MSHKKIITIFLLLPIIFLSFSSMAAFAAQGSPMQLQYPTIGQEKLLSTGKTPLMPQYLRYIFTFFIIIAGLIVLGSLLWAGFSYITSAGNRGQTTEAKSSILNAFIGAFILLASVILLNTINPSLTKIKLGTITSGIIVESTEGELKLVASYVDDFNQGSSENFVPSKIKIPPEYRDYIELFFFKEPYFKGEMLAGNNNWSCTGNDQGSGAVPGSSGISYTECTMPYPSGYEKGSLIANRLRPGVYVYKGMNNGRVPFYVNAPLGNLKDVAEFRDLGGNILGVRIYNGNDINSKWGVLGFFGENFTFRGGLYVAENKGPGWATPDIIPFVFPKTGIEDLEWPRDLVSIKPFQINSKGSPSIEIYRTAEYAETHDSGKPGRCNLSAAENGTLSNDCPRDALSLRVKGGNAVAFDDITQIKEKQPVWYFHHAEYFDNSDPNLNDNEEVGRCVCNRIWFGLWCSVWWSCVSNVLPFAIP